jgi:hypothetical protein
MLLLDLLLKLRHLRLGLLKCDVLHKHCLSHYVKRIGVSAKPLIKQRLSVWIFFLKFCLVYALHERVEEMLFLGSQLINLRRRSSCGDMPPLVIETRSCRQSCSA